MRCFPFVRGVLVFLVGVLVLAPLRPMAAFGPIPPAAEDARVAAAVARLTEVSGEPPFQTTRIFDRHGHLLYEVRDRGRRTVVGLHQVPRALVLATIATEDKHFYRHGGVDPEAIARAAYQNWRAYDIVSGASTIPQQLARLLLLDEDERFELSLNRKVREALLAIDLDNRYSKDELLEMYLNTVYYGNQAYGVAAAAEVYFGKTLAELSLAESAFLAGLPQAPVQYDPFRRLPAALERQRVVLDLMETEGYITAHEKAAALAEPIRVVPPPTLDRQAPHFVDYVRELLIERFGTEGLRHGLQVYTSVDPRYQQLAERIARAQIAQEGVAVGAENAAVVIIHPPTGHILAMVGSVDYENEAISGQVNMTTAPRQLGRPSSPCFTRSLCPRVVAGFYHLGYAGGFSLGGGRTYVPRNVTGRHYGLLRLRQALANSLNVPAVKLLHELGVPAMLATARDMGIRAWRGAEERYGLALAVGGYEVPLLELTHAYATLANNGAFVPLSPILEIRDSAGRVLFRAKPPDPSVQVVPAAAAYQVTDILADPRARQLVFGTGTALDTSRPTAVKTGTTDNFRDTLAVGYTSYLAIGVWVGNSNGRPMKNTLAFRVAAPIWHDLFETIWARPELHAELGFAAGNVPDSFAAPPGLYRAPVCDLMAGRFALGCPHAYTEVFAAVANAPAEAAAAAQGYCVPLLAEGMPMEVQAQARFVPLPRSREDRSAAQQWAARFGLRLHNLADCSPTVLARQPAPTPTPPAPRLFVFVPSPENEDQGLTGSRVTVAEGIRSNLNVRARPGRGAPVLGVLRPGQVALVRGGPQEADGESWLEIRIPETGLTGWVAAALVHGLLPESAAPTPVAQPEAGSGGP
ncbi:MAG: transglycosylase domain-containing protein [Anaerolineae bacterium]|nr:transglycosylase domain-containing protein [Anaerolineae bacterium]